ncbi:MAG: ABC transporter ATP-binding protein, partial [Acidobacteria bacterium]|nr:ABC transporter ATP-binding protein [Acidobacteriota bacterium]
IHLDPQILLLDEVLAVGDDRFQRKCLTRIRQIRDSGAAIIFISHDLVSVEQLCTRAGLIDEGRLVVEGEPAAVIGQYRARLAGTASPLGLGARWGSGQVRIDRVQTIGPDGPGPTVRTGDPLSIRIEYSAVTPVARPVVGLAIRKHDGTLVTGPNTRMCGIVIDELRGSGVVDYHVPRVPLLPGSYRLAVSVYDEALLNAYDHWEGCADLTVLEGGTLERFGVVTFEGEWSVR